MGHTDALTGVGLTRWHQIRREYQDATHHSAGSHVCVVSASRELLCLPEAHSDRLTRGELAEDLSGLRSRLATSAMPMRFLRGDALSPTRVPLDASRLAVWARSCGAHCALPDVFVVPSAMAWPLGALLAPSPTELSRAWPCYVEGREVRGIERVAQHACAPRGDSMWPSVVGRIVGPTERVELVLDLAPPRYGRDREHPRLIDRAMLAAQHVELCVTPRHDGSASCSIVLPASPWQNHPLAFEAREEERRAASVFCRLYERAYESLDAVNALCESAPDTLVGPDNATLDALLSMLLSPLEALDERYSRFRYAMSSPAPATLDALLSTCAVELLRERDREPPSAFNAVEVDAPPTPVHIDQQTADRLYAIFRWVRLARALSGDVASLELGGSLHEGVCARRLDLWIRSKERTAAWCSDVAMRAAEDEALDCGGSFEVRITGGEALVRFTIPLP